MVKIKRFCYPITVSFGYWPRLVHSASQELLFFVKRLLSYRNCSSSVGLVEFVCFHRLTYRDFWLRSSRQMLYGALYPFACCRMSMKILYIIKKDLITIAAVYDKLLNFNRFKLTDGPVGLRPQ